MWCRGDGEVLWVTTGQSRLSACIITYNEADRIEDCLRSVSFCDGPVGRLRGHLEHFSYRRLTDHLARMARYAGLMAHALYARSKRCGLLKVLLNPQWRFLRGYFVRLGFLDGWRGLVFALVEANYVR